MLVAGFAVALGAWWLLHAAFAHPGLLRRNYRGEPIPTAIGLAAVLAYVAVTGVAAWIASLDQPGDGVALRARALTLPAVLGFALLGLFDDLAGSGHHRGFGGHAGELGRGRLTTGMLKLIGGALVALAVVAALPEAHQAGWLLLDAALVALAANLANLLDRAPGRTTKVALLAFAALAIVTRRWSELSGAALATGATAGLLPVELRERGMLGDTGANAVGAALGVGVVLTASRPWRLGVLVALVVLNVASEWISFSRVIDATPPLRWLDRLGTRRA
jgi:UDP-N-acetylmuramyl pentapeptide phosphotransferase/UDP-N-acetylglucosamine-1-phosphate transferase